MSEIIWVTRGLSWKAFIYNNHVPTLSSNTAVTLGSNSFKKLLFCFPFMKIVRYKLNMHFNQAHFCLHLVRHVSVIVGHGWCLERHPEWVWHEQISVCSLCTQELRPHCQKKDNWNSQKSCSFSVTGRLPQLSGISRGLLLTLLTLPAVWESVLFHLYIIWLNCLLFWGLKVGNGGH